VVLLLVLQQFSFCISFFTLRRHFVLMNSGLNDDVMSAVKSQYIPLKVLTVSYFVPKGYSGVSGLRYILYRHVVLCCILELIGYFYTLQFLALKRSKIG
jgi:hypothetical protein